MIFFLNPRAGMRYSTRDSTRDGSVPPRLRAAAMLPLGCGPARGMPAH